MSSMIVNMGEKMNLEKINERKEKKTWMKRRQKTRNRQFARTRRSKAAQLQKTPRNIPMYSKSRVK